MTKMTQTKARLLNLEMVATIKPHEAKIKYMDINCC